VNTENTELTTVSAEGANPLATLNRFNQPSEVATRDMASVNQTRWVPSLSIAYGTSKACKERIAQPGDFVLGGQTKLGQTIKVIICDYRIRACIWDKDQNKFGDSCYHLSSSKVDVKDDTEYQAFINQKLPKGQELQTGVEFLLYIPEQNNFAVLFMKKTLSSYTQAIWSCGVGRLIELTTTLIQGKKGRDWYGLKVTPLNQAVRGSTLQIPGQTLKYDIDIPVDLFEQNHKLFVNPVTTAPVEDADESVPDIQR
jgi:hypothetical protein